VPTDGLEVQQADIQGRHGRLWSYIQTRVQHVDVEALTVAAKQADADQARSVAAIKASNCSTELDVVKLGVCLERATPRDIAVARERCEDISWLPY
jgi:hypothetical protein